VLKNYQPLGKKFSKSLGVG